MLVILKFAKRVKGNDCLSKQAHGDCINRLAANVKLHKTLKHCKTVNSRMEGTTKKKKDEENSHGLARVGNLTTTVFMIGQT